MDREALPYYRRGDVVLLSKTPKLDRSSVVYIVFKAREGLRALLREARPDKGGDLVLQPYAESFPLEFVEKKEIVALYRVVGKIEMFVAGMVG